LGVEVLRRQAAVAHAQDVMILMQESIDYMTDTLRDVLDIQKADEGVLDLHFKTFLLEECLKFVASKFTNVFESKKISLAIEIGSNVPASVFGDKEKIEHVLSIFVNNSIKYSAPTQEVRVVVSFDDGCVQFSVRDNGLIVHPDARDNAFVPYVSLSSHVRALSRGSDVGLVVSKEIVTLHGGIIGLRCEDGIPPTNDFYFSIPFETNVDDQSCDLLVSRTDNILEHLEKHNIEGVNVRIVKDNETVAVVAGNLRYVKPVDDVGRSSVTGKYVFGNKVLIVDGKRRYFIFMQ
jgi:signal transduction histidine kinase